MLPLSHLLTWILTFFNPENLNLKQGSTSSPVAVIQDTQCKTLMDNANLLKPKLCTPEVDSEYFESETRFFFENHQTRDNLVLLKHAVNEIKVKSKFSPEHLQLLNLIHNIERIASHKNSNLLIRFLNFVAAVDFEAINSAVLEGGDDLRQVIKSVYNNLSEETFKNIFGNLKRVDTKQSNEFFEMISRKGAAVEFDKQTFINSESFSAIRYNKIYLDLKKALCDPETSDQWKIYWVTFIGDLKEPTTFDFPNVDLDKFFGFSRIYSILALNLEHYPITTNRLLKVEEIKSVLVNGLIKEFEKIPEDLRSRILIKAEEANHVAAVALIKQKSA